MKKILAGFVAAFLAVAINSYSSNAQSYTVFTEYTESFTSTLTISGKTATCASRATGYLNIT